MKQVVRKRGILFVLFIAIVILFAIVIPKSFAASTPV